MKIYVETLQNNTTSLTVDVERNDEIYKVKQNIQRKEGIQPFQQTLMFNEKKLEDWRTLSDYNLQSEAILNLEILWNIQISVKTFYGKIITFDVNQNDTIDHVKKKIQKRRNTKFSTIIDFRRKATCK